MNRSLQYPLILASESPRREQILSMLGFKFSVLPSGVDETVAAGMDTAKVPALLAERKALAVSQTSGTALVLAADTIVVLDGTMLGKPMGSTEALKMLRFLRGRKHTVYTGVALAQSGQILGSATESSLVQFAPGEDKDLEAYSECGEPLDKAGAYAIQGKGAFLVEGIQGCFFNVMGLPIQKTLQLILPFQLI